MVRMFSTASEKTLWENTKTSASEDLIMSQGGENKYIK